MALLPGPPGESATGRSWFRGGLVFEALVSLSFRLKDLLGPVTRVKKK